MKETHKFTLKYSFDGSENHSPIDITFEIPGDSSIDQMLFNFECFLKACGFIFDGSFVQSYPEDKYEGCMADWDEEDGGPTYHDTLSTAICEDYKAKKLKEWNDGIAKLDKEVKKNKWFHGLCNPPSPDWKKK